MMDFFIRIKHFFAQKIYNATRIIDDEKRMENIRYGLSSIKNTGRNVNIENIDFLGGGKYMSVGDDFYCKKGGWLECIDQYNGQTFHPNLSIGNNFSMQCYCHIGCIDSIQIGNNVLLGSKIYITDHYHGEISKESLNLPPNERPLWSKPVKIGNNVWIGDNVSIMPGVSLGNNVIVGANSVVTHSFPDNTVIAGCPAKVIKCLDGNSYI